MNNNAIKYFYKKDKMISNLKSKNKDFYSKNKDFNSKNKDFLLNAITRIIYIFCYWQPS